MAIVRAYWALDMFDAQVFYGVVTQANSNTISLTDGWNTSVYGGFGFQYYGDSVVSGTLTSYKQYYTGSLLGEATGLNVPASTAYIHIMSNNLPGLYSVALSGNDTIYGSPYGDYLRGFAGNDLFVGGAGNDYIDGGAGIDTAAYSGARREYAVNYDSSTGTIVVVDKLGYDGADRLASVERIAFSDTVYNLEIAGKAASVHPIVLQSIVDLYIAYFNRVPEADGLGYWINQYRAGKSLDAIATDFYNSAIILGDFTGYRPDMPLGDYIRMAYENILGRTGDMVPANDVQWWIDEITSGKASRENMPARFISDSRIVAYDPAHAEQWGWMADYLDNRVELGILHAVTYGIDYYSQAEAHNRTVAITNLVTADSIDAAVAMIGLGPDSYI